jgi:hypothetical protein
VPAAIGGYYAMMGKQHWANGKDANPKSLLNFSNMLEIMHAPQKASTIASASI